MPTGIYVRTEECNKIHSEAMKGKTHPHKGHLLSEEHKRKLSEVLKGNTYAKGNHQKLSDETRKKMSEIRLQKRRLLGYLNSPEVREKISKANKGRLMPKGELSRCWKGGSKVYRKKSNNKRKRNLGFIPLNEFFEGSEFHHIDRERGLFIPIELHKSISHCVETGKNMKEINLVAFDYWSTMSFKHLKELIDKRQAFQ